MTEYSTPYRGYCCKKQEKTEVINIVNMSTMTIIHLIAVIYARCTYQRIGK